MLTTHKTVWYTINIATFVNSFGKNISKLSLPFQSANFQLHPRFSVQVRSCIFFPLTSQFLATSEDTRHILQVTRKTCLVHSRRQNMCFTSVSWRHELHAAKARVEMAVWWAQIRTFSHGGSSLTQPEGIKSTHSPSDSVVRLCLIRSFAMGADKWNRVIV